MTLDAVLNCKHIGFEYCLNRCVPGFEESAPGLQPSDLVSYSEVVNCAVPPRIGRSQKHCEQCTVEEPRSCGDRQREPTGNNRSTDDTATNWFRSYAVEAFRTFVESRTRRKPGNSVNVPFWIKEVKCPKRVQTSSTKSKRSSVRSIEQTGTDYTCIGSRNQQYCPRRP